MSATTNAASRTRHPSPLLIGLALISCSQQPSNPVAIGLPEAMRGALSAERATLLRATIEVTGLPGSENPLEIDAGNGELSGYFVLDLAEQTEVEIVVRLLGRHEQEGSEALLARLTGRAVIEPGVDNEVGLNGASWEQSGTPGFDLNRNGRSNLEDWLEAIDPLPPPPFLDVAPTTVAFYSGIQLGAFERQIVVLQNLSEEPIVVTAEIFDAPGVLIDRVDSSGLTLRRGARRGLEGADALWLPPLGVEMVAVSFAPMNSYLTWGGLQLLARSQKSNVTQGSQVRLIGNSGGTLQPPAPGYAPTMLRAGSDLGGIDPTQVVLYPADKLFSGRELSASERPATPDGGAGSTGAVGLLELSPTLITYGDGYDDWIGADGVYLVEIPPHHRFAATLRGHSSDIDLAAFQLDESDNLTLVEGSFVVSSRVGTEAVQLDNETEQARRMLLVLGRHEEREVAATPGAITTSTVVSFILTAHLYAGPELDQERPITPDQGPLEGGVQIVLKGRGFKSGARVTFAGVEAIDTVVGEFGRTVRCTLPAGSLEVGRNPATVVVVNPSPDEGGDGQAVTLPEGFTYRPPAPLIESIWPIAGPFSGGTPVTVNGRFFSGRSGGPVVLFGNLPAANVTLQGPDEIVAVAPPHAAEEIDITVGNYVFGNELATSNGVRFRYFDDTEPIPVIDSVSPTEGSVRGGDTIEVRGRHFTDGCRVLFDTERAAASQFVDAGLLRATSPAHGPGPVDLLVVSPVGTSGNLEGGFRFVVYQPAIASVSPDRVATAGGDTLTVRGENFWGDVAAVFELGNASYPAPSVTRLAFDLLLISTPAVDQPGAYTLRVINGDGSETSHSAVAFLDPAGDPPLIFQITPASVAVDEAARIEVTGRGFDEIPPPTIVVGPVEVAPSSIDDCGAGQPSERLCFELPTGLAPGQAVVRVVNADGQSSATVLNLTASAGEGPAIFSLTPWRGPTGTPVAVTMAGRNLGAQGAEGYLPPTVVVGGQLLEPQQIDTERSSTSTLYVELPAASTPHAAQIFVINTGGEMATAVFLFEGERDAGFPDLSAPDATAADAFAPDAAMTDTYATDTKTADTYATDTTMSDTFFPDVDAPDSSPLMDAPDSADASATPDASALDGNSGDGGNQPPWVEAGDDQATAPLQPVTLSATAGDRDGEVVTLEWQQVAGPAVDLSSTDQLVTSFQTPDVLCYEALVFELLVTDDDGDVASDRITVDVLDPGLGATITPGRLLDLEQNDGDLHSPGGVWEYGAPTSGPGRAHSGNRVWATGLEATYPPGALEVLCLPPLDLTDSEEPTLALRLWSTMWGAGDGLTVEMYAVETGWAVVAPALMPYDGSVNADDGPRPAWSYQGYRNQYLLAALSLAERAGATAMVRLVFRSTPSLEAAGSFVDDLAIFDETDDPDQDGLPGVITEHQLHGTDPFVGDSDGDGTTDGDEVSAGSDPSNPASSPAGTPILPGTLLDLEFDDGGMATDGELWQHGEPSTGPLRAHRGVQVWATNLTGNYFPSAVEALYLPPIDLSASTRATLSFRLWTTSWGAGDGVSVEVKEPGLDWSPLPIAFPAYDGSDGAGNPAWSFQGYQDEYVFAAASLAPYAGQPALQARFIFRSSSSLEAAGAYIDDVAVTEETDDPDGDGVPGVIDEYQTHGTDPFVADSDHDGTSDGDELSAGTGLLNPADYPGAPVVLPGTTLDLATDDGGLATTGRLWEYGPPTDGPATGHTGPRAWATRLAGAYFPNARELLYLPPLDLTDAVEPTLSMRIWVRTWGEGDGLRLEALRTSWGSFATVVPAYDGTDGSGLPAWSHQEGAAGQYVFTAISLNDFVDRLTRLRLSFRSNNGLENPGAYIDDIGLHSEQSDPDSDGLLGVLTEYNAHGTDPFDPDSDDDGVTDGDEVGAGTDPLDPLSF